LWWLPLCCFVYREITNSPEDSNLLNSAHENIGNNDTEFFRSLIQECDEGDDSYKKNTVLVLKIVSGVVVVAGIYYVGPAVIAALAAKGVKRLWSRV